MNKKGSFSLVRAPRGFLSVSRHSRFASALLAMVFCACSPLSWAQTSGDTTEPPCENLPPDDPSYCGNPGDLNDTAPGVRPESEYERRIRSSEQLAPLSSEAFGEQVSLSTGQTEFGVVDIDLPGNNALPVQLRRRFVVNGVDISTRTLAPETYGGFGNWDIDVPYISGVFDGYYGWEKDSRGNVQPRCSHHFQPAVSLPDVRLKEVWSGNSVHIPGQGDRELLWRLSDGVHPADGNAYHWTTTAMEAVSCTGSGANEGFVLHAPDGLVYTFNKRITRRERPIRSHGHNAGRIRIYLLATEVRDRHGNWVSYGYNDNGHPTSITTSPGDGRSISLTYAGSGAAEYLSAVTVGDRTWHYHYAQNEGKVLTGVTLPDGSQWSYDYELPSTYGGYEGVIWVKYENPDGTGCTATEPCCRAPRALGGWFTLAVTHPAGARGTFEFNYGQRGRSGVPDSMCIIDEPGSWHNGPTWSPLVPFKYRVMGLETRTITGPGISSPQVWSYNYGAVGENMWAVNENDPGTPCPSCQSKKTVTVTQPDNSRIEYDFGVKFRENDGKLLATRHYSPSQVCFPSCPSGSSLPVLLRTDTTTYMTDTEAASQPFADTYGDMDGGEDPAAVRIRPVTKQATTQQGVTFTRHNTSFNVYAQPTHATLSSTLGYSRTEATTYENNALVWLLGQVETVTSGGLTMVANSYDPTNGDLWSVTKYGALERSMTWYGDGTLHTVADGKGNTTTFSSYYRGVPRTIQFADESTRSAEVDGFGQIEWVEDEIDTDTYARTSYAYDDAGRLTGIVYPAEETGGWNPTSRVFEQVNTTEYGLAPGHWRMTENTGTAEKVVYYDGLWRPIVSGAYDTADVAGTARYTRHAYDHAGRETFTSYPSQSPNGGPGVTRTFDALGRALTSSAYSELGNLLTTTQYLGSFRTQVTDPRLHSVTTSYQAFDTPTTDFPTLISAPGRTTTIDRDNFGKPRSVTRSGGGDTLTRSYGYDGNQRLCRVTEPESGTKVLHYDLAGNVDWYAEGISSPSCTATIQSNERVDLDYDDRNRLTDTTFHDGTAAIHNSYWPDGALKTTATGNTSWTYLYNNRRLLESEALEIDDPYDAARSFLLDWGYDANGSVSQLMYPDTSIVDFAPNALGQPTQAGGYATGVEYYPNGAMKEFTYGNGIVHNLTQNARQLPLRSHDGAAMDLTYAYDPNGNVDSITDGAQDGLENRTMTYDGLDRLLTANAPELWGTASFSYDALDNLQTANVGIRQCTYNHDGLNRLRTLTGSNCTGSYDYDARGNVISRNTQDYAFDRANRLTAVVGEESYQYDGLGRRVLLRGVGGTSHRYQVYGKSGQLLWGYVAQTDRATRYVYLNGSLVARDGDGVDSAPTLGVAPNPSTGDYTVNWTAVDGAGFYRLEEGSTEVYAGPDLGKSFTNRAPGSYPYRVRACANATPASCGGGYSATVTGKVIGAPNPLTSNDNPSSDGSYILDWPSIGVPTYRLRETTSGQSWKTTTSQKSFTDQSPGTYRYLVAGCIDSFATDCGPYTTPDLVQIVENGGPGTPGVPGGLVLNPNPSGDGNYTLTWGAVSGATSYKVKESFNGGALLEYTVTGNAWSPNPAKDTNGRYAYRVSACNASGCSADSAQVSEVVGLLPGSFGATPNGVHPLPCNGPYDLLCKYNVHWDPVQGATGYVLNEYNSHCGWSDLIEVTDTGQSTRYRVDFNGRMPSCENPGHWYYRVRSCIEGSFAATSCGPWSDSVPVEINNNISLLPPGPTGTAGTTYLHTDALGSVVAETDAAGTVTQRFRYEPYGAPADGDFDAFGQNPGYTGHVMDGETGLVYMQQRYYDPLGMRFWSVDPVAVDTGTGWNFNRYNYAANNPYKFTDPDGRCPQCAWGVPIGAGVNFVVQMATGKGSFSERLSNVSWKQVGVAAVAGGLSGGVSAIANTATTTTGAVVANVIGNAGVGAVATQASAQVEGKTASVGDVVQGTALSGAASGAGAVIEAAPGVIARSASSGMSQTERVATGNLLGGRFQGRGATRGSMFGSEIRLGQS